MKTNKMAKKTLALVLSLAALGGSLGVVGCTQPTPDTDQTLEVFIWDAGYGVSWCEKMLQDFQNEDWVKTKYPNLQVVFDSDAASSTGTNKIDAGERANTVDLFLIGGMGNYIGKNSAGYEMFCDLTETVYEQKIPGEGNATVMSKMLPDYLNSIRYYEVGEFPDPETVPFKSYVFPWASGMDGILYNEEHLTALGLEVPLTTNQFVEECEIIKADKSLPYKGIENDDFAIMSEASCGYWDYLYPVWWGQYEGIDNYYNFFNGLSYTDGLPAMDGGTYRQRGKLHSLVTMEKMLKWSNGYVYKGIGDYGHRDAQIEFIKGMGVFYANGDWFSKETAEDRAELKMLGDKAYKIRMMPTPIVSEIVERTPSIVTEGNAEETERRLRAVIRGIDKGWGNAYSARVDDTILDYELLRDVTDEDYDIIKHARGIVHALGANHNAGVPSYAKGKEVAFDFLVYMASDKAQETYMRETGGASLPFDYDLKEENETLYNELFADGETYRVAQDRLAMVYDSCYETNVLPWPTSFPLVRWGEMHAVHSVGAGSSVVSYFAGKTSAADGRQVWLDDIDYYITQGNFDVCKGRAGL